jgi:hypothetical protein
VKRLAIPRHERRVLLLGAVSISTLVLLSRGGPAWLAWQREARASAAEAAGELAGAQLLVRLRGVLGDTLNARSARYLALAPAVLSGRSPAAAGATLAGLVSGAAAAAGVRLGAVQVLSDSAGPSTFTRVSVRADATGDVRGLTRLLEALERGPTLLAVREISVTQPEPAATPNRAESLRVEIVVAGLALNPPSRSMSP